MPRRIYTYRSGMGWDGLKLTSSRGAPGFGLGMALTPANAVLCLRRGSPAGADPWCAGALDWATAPPRSPAHLPAIAVVHGPYALWQGAPADAPPHVMGLATPHRQVLATSVIDADPDPRADFPTPSIWPFLAAVATTILFVGVLFTPWGVVWG